MSYGPVTVSEAPITPLVGSGAQADAAGDAPAGFDSQA
jgi:hypothetical protein